MKKCKYYKYLLLNEKLPKDINREKHLEECIYCNSRIFLYEESINKLSEQVKIPDKEKFLNEVYIKLDKISTSEQQIYFVEYLFECMMRILKPIPLTLTSIIIIISVYFTTTVLQERINNNFKSAYNEQLNQCSTSLDKFDLSFKD